MLSRLFRSKKGQKSFSPPSWCLSISHSPECLGSTTAHDTHDNESPLLTAARKGHVRVVRALLNAGPQRPQDMQEALYWSCHYGHRTIVCLLLHKGADPALQDNDGWTPLMAASRNGHSKVVALLLQHHTHTHPSPPPSPPHTHHHSTQDDSTSQPNDPWRTPPRLSCPLPPPPPSPCMLDLRNSQGQSALWLACAQGHVKVARKLLQHGADDSTPDSEDGRTPRQAAMERGWSVIENRGRKACLQLLESYQSRPCRSSLRRLWSPSRHMVSNATDTSLDTPPHYTHTRHASPLKRF